MFEKSVEHLEPIWQKKKLGPDFLATGLARQPQQIINAFDSNQFSILGEIKSCFFHSNELSISALNKICFDVKK